MLNTLHEEHMNWVQTVSNIDVINISGYELQQDKAAAAF